jgi:predicted RNase H-like nuclease
VAATRAICRRRDHKKSHPKVAFFILETSITWQQMRQKQERQQQVQRQMRQQQVLVLQREQQQVREQELLLFYRKQPGQQQR